MPPSGFEGFLEELGDALVVFRSHVVEHRGGLGLEVLPGELGHHLALEIVDEAGPEDEFLAFGGLGIGGPGADHDDPGVFADAGRGDGVARGVGADDGQDVVLADELLGRGRGRLGLVFIIFHKQLDEVFLVPQLQAAPGVDLGGQEFHGVFAGVAHRGFAAGEFGVDPDADLIFRSAAASRRPAKSPGIRQPGTICAGS